MLNDPNPKFLRLVQSDEFLPPLSRWTTLGGLFLVGTFGTAAALASVIKYNVTVKAPATVRPAGELRIVQASAEGSVKRILVKENQVVKKGDALVAIDDERLLTQKSQLEVNIQQGHLQLAQIDAQISALDTQMTAESSFMNRTIASAQADLSRNQREYRERQITTQTEVQEASAALELAQEQLKRYQQLANSGAIATLQIKEKEQAFIAAQVRLERAKATLNPSAAPVAMATERIAQERARGESTLATLKKERESLQSGRIEIQNQLNRDRQELQQIETEIKKSVVKAPESGTILKLELRNPGQVVRSGDAIAQIAPSNTPLVIKARIAAQDIGKVKVCQQKKVEDCKEGKAILKISAYPYPDYGTLKGTVSAIAPDAITSESKD